MTNLMETASQLGAKVTATKDQAADALHAAASSVRATGRQGSEAIDNLATGAADKLDATASYVDDHDLRGVFTGVRQAVRRYPTGSLVIATALGFCAGSAIRRMTHSCARDRAKARA
jgi:ABC-type transporter Mla subunit MlaD